MTNWTREINGLDRTSTIVPRVIYLLLQSSCRPKRLLSRLRGPKWRRIAVRLSLQRTPIPMNRATRIRSRWIVGAIGLIGLVWFCLGRWTGNEPQTEVFVNDMSPNQPNMARCSVVGNPSKRDLAEFLSFVSTVPEARKYQITKIEFSTNASLIARAEFRLGSMIYRCRKLPVL